MNLIFSALIVAVGYLAYFYINVVQFSRISKTSVNLNMGYLETAEKMTLSSYYNMTIILCGLIFIMVSSTIGFSKNSLFFSKTLPFTGKEIYLSFKLFKLIISYLIFEAIFIAVLPGISMFTMNVLYALMVLINVHIIFFIVNFFLELLYEICLKILKDKGVIALNLIIFTFIMFHFFVLRFKVDKFIGNLDFSVSLLITLSFLVNITLLLSIVCYLYLKKKFNVNFFIRLKYINVPLIIRNKFVLKVIAAILRTRLYLITFGFIFLSLIVSSIYNGINLTVQNSVFLLPMIGISLLPYADSTIAERKMYANWRISYVSEISLLILFIIINAVPSLALGLLAVNSLDPFVYSVDIALVSIIVGFMFPKSLGNANETASAIIMFLIIVVLTLLINIPWSLYPVTLVLLIVLGKVITNKKGENYESDKSN